MQYYYKHNCYFIMNFLFIYVTLLCYNMKIVNSFVGQY